MSPWRGSHGLNARRARRTKSRGPKGLQLEVGARRAPRLIVSIAKYIDILGLAEHSSCYQPNWTSVDGLMSHIQLTLSVFLIEKLDPVEIFGIMILSLYFDSAYWYFDSTCWYYDSVCRYLDCWYLKRWYSELLLFMT